MSARTPSLQVEDALVEAAERILASGGPEALSVRRIAAEAGVAPMSVYNRFGGKNGIVEQLYIRGFDELAGAARGVDEDDAGAAVIACGEAYWRFAMDRPATYAVMFDRAVAGFEPSPDAWSHAAAAFGELVAHVRRAMAAGAVADGDPVDVAQQLWESLHGLVSLTLRSLGFVAEVDAHRRRLFTTLLRGLAPPTPGG
ncbi:MAG: TetR/AcrR family transcriptional regulator [Acidimicrobiia bacterium]